MSNLVVQTPQMGKINIFKSIINVYGRKLRMPLRIKTMDRFYSARWRWSVENLDVIYLYGFCSSILAQVHLTIVALAVQQQD